MRDDTFLDDHMVDTGPLPLFKPASTIVWGSILIFGVFFRFLHWPGATLLVVAGLGGLTGYLLSCMMEKQSRTLLSVIFTVLVVGIALYSIIGSFVLERAWLSTSGAGIYGGVIIVIFIVYEGTRRSMLKRSKLNSE